MLKWFMKRKLKAFGDAFDYDTGYMQELVDIDPAAGLVVSRLSAAASYRADAPVAAWFAGKLVAGMNEDCGPCVQLGVRMAERSGVSASDLRAIIAGDVARMSAEASLGYCFAKALLVRSGELDDLREEIIARWGRKALGAISIGIVTTRTFPALKYALGHGQTCQSVEIGGDMVAPTKLGQTAYA
ncbi:MAG TPA: hypothetical protein VJ822_15855 [Dongiaceae bacterium]|nr:hypothetical protein [Dongiaceae bacterium]